MNGCGLSQQIDSRLHIVFRFALVDLHLGQRAPLLAGVVPLLESVPNAFVEWARTLPQLERTLYARRIFEGFTHVDELQGQASRLLGVLDTQQAFLEVRHVFWIEVLALSGDHGSQELRTLGSEGQGLLEDSERLSTDLVEQSTKTTGNVGDGFDVANVPWHR